MIALDVESSGLDPKEASIVSIGAVDTDDPTNQFYDECRVWDGADINDQALEVNGFKREELLGTDAEARIKKTEAELIRDFVAWATDRPQNRTLLAQNVRFDLSFVQEACKRAGTEFPFAHRVLDLHTLGWMHMTLRGITPPVAKHRTALDLTGVLAYCGLPEEAKPHNALNGALAHAECFARMAYTKNIIEDYSTFQIPWTRATS
jgi:DNA polymerase III epsilon subunit-like protein